MYITVGMLKPKRKKEIQQERARTSAEAAGGRHSPVCTKAAPQVAAAPSRSRAAAGGLCLLYWREVGLKEEGGVKRWARRTSAVLVSKIQIYKGRGTELWLY